MMAFKSTAVGSCNAAVLFILVCTFTAVCQADGVISVICEDVTGTVGEEVTFSCSVTVTRSECCILMYMFRNPEINNYTEICRQVFALYSCERRNSFTCRYTPTTAMTEQSRFFVQTTCGSEMTSFTVNITEPQKHVTAAPNRHAVTEVPGNITGHGSMALITTGAVAGCVIFIIFIILTSIFCVKRFKRTNPSGFQMKYERGVSAEPTTVTLNDHSETK